MALITAISSPHSFFIPTSVNGGICHQLPIRPSTPVRLQSSVFLPIVRPVHFQNFCSSLPKCSDDHSSSDQIAVLLEVDGVLIDAYQLRNRQAFNVAFQKLGLDCAKWTDPIYLDLARKGVGDEEKMLALYFNRIGWPTSLPTSEKGTFMRSVLEEKKKAMAAFMSSQNTPLRPGVEKFIDDAFEEGICVGILAACSKFGEEIARQVVEKLGVGRLLKVKVIGRKEIEESLYGQLVYGGGKFSSMDDEIANEASRAVVAERKRIAEEVAAMLKLKVDINTRTPESLQDIVTALRAGAENAKAPVRNCVLVAGSQPLIVAAGVTGMPCIVLRNSMTSRVEFQPAVVMDGFGDVDLTVSKLRLMLSRL